MNRERNDASPPSAWHVGEQAVQIRLGVRNQLEAIGSRVLRDFMPDQHREFFAELPLLFVGSLDARNRPWASALVGRPGFVGSPDARTLRIEAMPGFGDPLGANLSVGAPVGLLGIQLETRRRNRMNGTVEDLEPGHFTVRVGQSFGNCPKYIQAREPSFTAEPASVAQPRPLIQEGPLLTPPSISLVQRADTFFIASASPHARTTGGTPAHPGEGIDISHRGGKPGFVRVTEADGGGASRHTVLTAPDFLGNFFFNTLGNLEANPRAGLLFLDFSTGDTLSLTGTADVVWDGPELRSFDGAERLLRFHVQEGVRIPSALPVRWSAVEPSPQLRMTGAWPT